MSAKEVLRSLEWSGTYSYCTGWKCCPICRGVYPPTAKNQELLNIGHYPDCKLQKALNES